MSKPELIYFNAKGRAEQIRLCLVHAGVDFTDTRLSGFEEFGKRKMEGEFLFGSVPVLKDGDFQLAQGCGKFFFKNKKLFIMLVKNMV
jgi:hypothetical protein